MAVQMMSLVPVGKEDPDAIVQVDAIGASPPVTVGAEYVTVDGALSTALKTSAGQLMLGGTTGSGMGTGVGVGATGSLPQPLTPASNQTQRTDRSGRDLGSTASLPG